MADTSADVCAICLGGMRRGHASFTAECSHAFHVACISASVAHGHGHCPLCKAPWIVLPPVNNADPAAPAVPRPDPPRAVRRHRPRRTGGRGSNPYADDEPVEEQGAPVANGGGGAVVLRTHCECPAIARNAARDSFAVLVHAKAPQSAAAARAPLDLVTVLDVSGSMTFRKLDLVKQAMGFVIDHLGTADRLSVVSFSTDASRLTPLALMSFAGKASARIAVESLVACGSTNIGEGLRVAAKVLDSRRYKNAVAGIILLSDGQDTRITSRNYISLVPPSFTRAGSRPPPIHTFGFGTDHDAAAMHTIAEATGGTFSFIENQEAIQDSFAQCIGGLLTVVVQEAHIAVECLLPGVRVREVKFGHYDSCVDADGRAASIAVGELYADEERRFLLILDVPISGADVTRLLKVGCTYRDIATGHATDVAGDDAMVQRPVEVPDDAEPSLEVEQERVLVAAADDLAAALEAADRGAHDEAVHVLRRGLLSLKSARRRAGVNEKFVGELEGEMEEMCARVEDESEYLKTGRACLLVGMSSHAQQRAATREVNMRIGKRCGMGSGGGGGRLYRTPAMRAMVNESMKSRGQQQAKKRKRVKGR